LEGFGVTLSDLTGFFFDRGYQLYHYKHKVLTVTPVSAVVEDNYVFVHPSRADRLRDVLKR
jgi:hypothetical protein